MSKAWTPADIPSQAGRRVIVTRGNSGIGWYTALELARAGAQVTIGARSKAKGEDAAERIRHIVPTAQVRSGVLDLSNRTSVQSFADSQLEGGHPIDMLINNAGIMGLPKREVSVDGHELQFATNVFGPYRLTGLLLPALLQADRPRVVTVASGTHKMFKPGPITDLCALAPGIKPDPRNPPFNDSAMLPRRHLWHACTRLGNKYCLSPSLRLSIHAVTAAFDR
ncbi:short-chain dehydrogenase/reductase SDR (plasmid) [Sinorhizobium americanum CCGM7]|uniref:SDR family NAD(P)-dependent oxidoreductase n=1 Tax=Sinorhizobium americanum TaxID=194963 RepID=UPI0004D545EA|nr:SDR family NAD(P)-dependent oxidoreductase [Sinorhizobium americanum]APG86573.1 short-chain dehydrogenase/reductase SDR [Sinorhizobium americanum CCGM7]